MDPFSVAKLGDVTIQRVPAKPEDSKPKVNKDCGNEVISNDIASQILQLSKLSSSINITVKSNSSSSSVTPSTKSDNAVDNSDLKQIQSNELDQIQTDPNLKVVSLGPGVELRKKETPASNIVKDVNSTTNETNLEIKHTDEDEKAEDDNASLNDDACDNETEETTRDKSESSDFDCRDENEELCDAEDDCDKKMDCDSSNVEVKSDTEESNAVHDDKETKPLENQTEQPDTDNVEGEESKEDELANDEDANDEPTAPSEELPDDSSENVVCKEEQLSENEQNSSESEDADDEFDKTGEDSENSVPKKKKKRKPKSEDGSDEDSNDTKKQKTSPTDEAADSENSDKPSAELKKGLLRKNIREVMDETKLEEATLAAQRQEMERRRRVQEQQKIIRDVQRQIAQNRQNSKMQARVLSLLQKGTTSIIKKEEEEGDEEMVEESKPNTVVVKLSTGSGPPQIVNKKVLDLLKKQNSTADEEEEEIAKEKLVNLSKNLDKPQMMTPSVSIAPIKQESKPIEVINEQEEEEEEEEEKPKDVVMISSSSGEEDDCIVISEEEEESEPDEDPTNSGMHTNDLYNVPDEQGRVLINVGHPDSEKDVFLAPQIARIIKPHQIGGVRFLFDNIVESLSRFSTSEGFGCILAHSMGLGKTLQVVSFCDVFLRYTEAKSVLCIMPINTLQNWVAEFNMWLPTDPESSPFKEHGEVSTRHFPIFVLNDNQKTLSARAKVIQNWSDEGGVLLIGYELYRQLSLKKPPKSRNRSKRKTEAEEDLEDEKCKNMLECMYNALVNPGPDLVICDEGHRIKNSHASISQALKQIKSKRRVVLTGYPLQNNLMEYWCMVDFVRPNYLGTKTEFSNMFERPIQNGQCIDSTPQDIKLMRFRAHVLHSLLEGFVQRRSHSVLQQTLPTKYEYVLLLRLTPLQKALYNTFMNEVVRTKAVPNPLKAFAVCCKIWNHPDILYNFLKKRAGDEELDLDIEDAAASIGTPASGPSTPITPSTPPHQVKRTRNRGGKTGKDAKLPRKNPRVSSSPTNPKTPLIAAVPPNTANTTKSTSPERPTSTNAPISFDSFNNQFPNFNQSNETFREFNQSNNVNQNYNNQFGQEYGSQQNISNNQEFSGTNYQQNFNESNFYDSGFNQQNNYWQGNNESGNFFNSNTSGQSNQEYFQPNTSSNSSQYGSSSEYGTNTENSQGNYNNSNYNFINSQMNYPNEFSIKPEPGTIFGLGDQNASGSGDLMMDGSGDLSSQAFSDVGSGNEMNFRDNSSIYDSNIATQHFGNQNAMNKAGIDNISMLNNMSEQVRNDATNNMAKNRRQGVQTFNSNQGRGVHSSSVRLPANTQNFNPTFNPQQSKPGARMPANRGRNNAMMGVRSGAVGRPRNNANFRGGAGNKDMSARDEEFMKFKPGLPGGAPVLKHGITDGQQSFQNITPNIDNQAHLLGNQMTVGADDLNMFAQNQMNANFLDSLRSEELWNPNSVVDQNTLFPEQNYMYDDTNQILNSSQTANFIPNETPSLLGGVRAPRGLINEIPSSDNLFAGVQPNYQHGGAAGAVADHDLFNYLNELNTNFPISSHTSFMGLLEGDDNLGINRNAAANDIVMKNTQFPSTSTAVNDGNFLDPAMQFSNANLLNQTTPMNVPNTDLLANKTSTTQVSFEPTQGSSLSSSLPLEKDVNQSLMGLARRGQITLKVIDKKNESQAKLNEQSVMEQSRLESAAGASGDALTTQQTQAPFQNVQSRLPSIDVFNTSQNFVGAARMNPESSNFPQMEQFTFTDNQTNTNTSQGNQTNWENFDVPTAQTSKYNVQQTVAEKPPSQFGFNQNHRIMQPKESPQYDHRTVSNIKPEPTEEKSVQMSAYNSPDNRSLFGQSTASNVQETTPKEELHNQYIGSQVEHKKILDEKSNKYSGLASGKPDTVRVANKPISKMNPPSSVAPKVTEKKQPQRRNMSLAARTEMAAKQFQNNESFADSRQSANATLSPGSVNVKSNTSTNPAKITIKTEPKDVKTCDAENTDAKMPAPEVPPAPKSVKEEPGIPYDWTNEFFKDYTPGKIEASAKTLIFFCMLEEIVQLGDRLLLFSQSLFTLDLIEDFLQMFNIPGTEEKWARNKSYFRLDGSTTALEREKLINEFNSNPNVHLFLVSTRAGSLGINLVGANRVVVFDASWNPCHDTQAVCRVYRYGQQKSCYVYRFVVDNCLEKKIYDRQINKQGMSDRVVDECNLDAHLTIKDVSNLCWDDEEISNGRNDYNEFKEKYSDGVIRTIIEKFSPSLSKEPFQHESLLVDRKDKQLSQAEKRQAKRSYEAEKQASLKPSYGFYNNPHSLQNRINKPMASVRPMQADNNQAQRENPRRWIPAEVWQKQGMSAQEMTLPLDVVIPTNTPDTRSSIVLKAGQKVMVLKSPKGIYMQLENGKIIAIKTALKPGLGQNKVGGLPRALGMSPGGLKMLPRPAPERSMPLGNRRDVTVSPIRNRFVGNMRANTNMPMGGMRPGFAHRGPRPNQPIVRQFPLSRTPSPQLSSTRPRLPAPGNKQIFGPNSSVTISLANKKKMEIQEQANMTEVNYEDYNDGNRIKDMQHIGQSGKKSDDENSGGEKRSQFVDYSAMDDRAPAKGTDSSLNYSTSQISEPSKPQVGSHAAESSTKPGPSQSNQTRYLDMAGKPAAKYSDAIPEALRFKKDINLTPVASSVKSETANAPKPVSEMMRKPTQTTSFQGTQQQQQRYQLQQQKLQQANPKLAMNRRENIMASKMDSNAAARAKIAKPDTSNLNIPESILTKKEVQLSVRNPESVSKSSSQPAISIFPVGKKQEDGGSARSANESISSGFETAKNAPSSSSFYGEYQKPYRDYYQSNYSSNFSQHQTPEYPSQSQHSFTSAQYPSSVPYSGHEYGSGSYNASDNSQYNVNHQVFSNQSHAPSASNSFNTYNQYGWQNFPQQSKTESSQHSPVPPAPPSQPPSQ